MKPPLLKKVIGVIGDLQKKGLVDRYAVGGGMAVVVHLAEKFASFTRLYYEK